MTKQKKLTTPVMDEVKKEQADLAKAAHRNRMQRLVLRGEWLEKHEAQLKVIQSCIGAAMSDWYEDDSEEADHNAIYQMNDALSLLVDVVRDLRYECFCPDEQRSGILYYHGFKGAVTEVVNFNKTED